MRDERRLKSPAIPEPSMASSVGNSVSKIPDPMDGLNVMRSPLEHRRGLPDRAPDLRERLKELQSATHMAPVEIAEPADSLESPELRPALTFRRRNASGDSEIPRPREELD